LLQAKGDLYTAAYFLADADLAEYQVIVSFLILGQTIAWIILGPFQKNIYRWKEGDLNPLKRKFVGLGVLISSVFSVSLYFGLKLFYQIQLPNWYPFLFFAAIFPMYLYLIENQILLKYKQENQLFKFSILSGAISVGMAILLIPTFGITGALIGSVLGSAVVVVLVLYRFKKIIN
jgi:O-antigen/teichoic acid export membrane protein